MVLIFKKITKLFFLLIILASSLPVLASETNGTISPSAYTAVLCKNNDCSIKSLINFRTSLGLPVTITDSSIRGHAWSEDLGWINLNPTAAGVTNTSRGILAGYAWGENAGWINFKPSTAGVIINNAGEFVGHAWSENYGWLKFDCQSAGACLKTDWRPEGARSTSSGSQGGGGTTTLPPPVPPTQPVNPPSETLPPTQPVNPPYETLPTPEPTNPPTDLPGSLDPEPTDNPTIPDTNPSVPPSDPISTNPNTSHSGNGSQPETTGQAISSLIEAIFNPTNNQLPNEKSPSAVISNALTNLSQKVIGAEKTEAVKEYFTEQTEVVAEVINTPTGQATTKVATTAGVVSGAYLSTTTALFANPLTAADLFLIPIRLWGLLMIALGIRKRNLPWGTVYDSVTKQPLDPAYVVLKDLTGKEVATSITDLDGRYGFLVPPGRYVISAGKTNYSFPSIKLAGDSHDELYQDLYFGEIIDLTEGGVISKNIPMDPVKFDWNEFAKKDKKLMKFFSNRGIWLSRISNFIFILGLVITLVIVLVSPNTYNYIILGFYLVMLILKNTILKPRSFGRIKYQSDGTPLSFAIMRVFSKNSDREVIHKVTDQTGKYFCLIPNGLYYAKIENKNIDETYSPVHITGTLEVKKGYLNKEFDV